MGRERRGGEEMRGKERGETGRSGEESTQNN